MLKALLNVVSRRINRRTSWFYFNIWNDNRIYFHVYSSKRKDKTSILFNEIYCSLPVGTEDSMFTSNAGSQASFAFCLE